MFKKSFVMEMLEYIKRFPAIRLLFTPVSQKGQ
jgi:hypothetical protein